MNQRIFSDGFSMKAKYGRVILFSKHSTMLSYHFVPLMERLNSFCFETKSRMYSSKFHHCSIILIKTYFIVSHCTEECCSTYWAATSVNSCNLVSFSCLALNSLKNYANSQQTDKYLKEVGNALFERCMDFMQCTSVNVQKCFILNLFQFPFQVFLKFKVHIRAPSIPM